MTAEEQAELMRKREHEYHEKLSRLHSEIAKLAYQLRVKRAELDNLYDIPPNR